MLDFLLNSRRKRNLDEALNNFYNESPATEEEKFRALIQLADRYIDFFNKSPTKANGEHCLTFFNAIQLKLYIERTDHQPEIDKSNEALRSTLASRCATFHFEFGKLLIKTIDQEKENKRKQYETALDQLIISLIRSVAAQLDAPQDRTPEYVKTVNQIREYIVTFVACAAKLCAGAGESDQNKLFLRLETGINELERHRIQDRILELALLELDSQRSRPEQNTAFSATDRSNLANILRLLTARTELKLQDPEPSNALLVVKLYTQALDQLPPDHNPEEINRIGKQFVAHCLKMKANAKTFAQQKEYIEAVSSLGTSANRHRTSICAAGFKFLVFSTNFYAHIISKLEKNQERFSEILRKAHEVKANYEKQQVLINNNSDRAKNIEFLTTSYLALNELLAANPYDALINLGNALKVIDVSPSQDTINENVQRAISACKTSDLSDIDVRLLLDDLIAARWFRPNDKIIPAILAALDNNNYIYFLFITAVAKLDFKTDEYASDIFKLVWSYLAKHYTEGLNSFSKDDELANLWTNLINDACPANYLRLAEYYFKDPDAIPGPKYLADSIIIALLHLADAHNPRAKLLSYRIYKAKPAAQKTKAGNILARSWLEFAAAEHSNKSEDNQAILEAGQELCALLKLELKSVQSELKHAKSNEELRQKVDYLQALKIRWETLKNAKDYSERSKAAFELAALYESGSPRLAYLLLEKSIHIYQSINPNLQNKEYTKQCLNAHLKIAELFYKDSKDFERNAQKCFEHLTEFLLILKGLSNQDQKEITDISTKVVEFANGIVVSSIKEIITKRIADHEYFLSNPNKNNAEVNEYLQDSQKYTATARTWITEFSSWCENSTVKQIIPEDSLFKPIYELLNLLDKPSPDNQNGAVSTPNNLDYITKTITTISDYIQGKNPNFANSIADLLQKPVEYLVGEQLVDNPQSDSPSSNALAKIYLGLGDLTTSELWKRYAAYRYHFQDRSKIVTFANSYLYAYFLNQPQIRLARIIAMKIEALRNPAVQLPQPIPSDSLTSDLNSNEPTDEEKKKLEDNNVSIFLDEIDLLSKEPNKERYNLAVLLFLDFYELQLNTGRKWKKQLDQVFYNKSYIFLRKLTESTDETISSRAKSVYTRTNEIFLNYYEQLYQELIYTKKPSLKALVEAELFESVNLSFCSLLTHHSKTRDIQGRAVNLIRNICSSTEAVKHRDVGLVNYLADLDTTPKPESLPERVVRSSADNDFLKKCTLIITPTITPVESTSNEPITEAMIVKLITIANQAPTDQTRTVAIKLLRAYLDKLNSDYVILDKQSRKNSVSYSFFSWSSLFSSQTPQRSSKKYNIYDIYGRLTNPLVTFKNIYATLDPNDHNNRVFEKARKATLVYINKLIKGKLRYYLEDDKELADLLTIAAPLSLKDYTPAAKHDQEVAKKLISDYLSCKLSKINGAKYSKHYCDLNKAWLNYCKIQSNEAFENFKKLFVQNKLTYNKVVVNSNPSVIPPNPQQNKPHAEEDEIIKSYVKFW